MTCYFRHLTEIFEKAGIEVTKENRREIDRVIRNIVGVRYGSCIEVWKEIKKRITADKADFASQLKNSWKKRK